MAIIIQLKTLKALENQTKLKYDPNRNFTENGKKITFIELQTLTKWFDFFYNFKFFF